MSYSSGNTLYFRRYNCPHSHQLMFLSALKQRITRIMNQSMFLSSIKQRIMMMMKHSMFLSAIKQKIMMMIMNKPMCLFSVKQQMLMMFLQNTFKIHNIKIFTICEQNHRQRTKSSFIMLCFFFFIEYRLLWTSRSPLMSRPSSEISEVKKIYSRVIKQHR